jgi:cysteine-rich repeat protein
MLALAGCLQAASTPCGAGGVCPPDWRCVQAGSKALCAPRSCGDGVVDPGEACDDGNNISGDGCPADCRPPCGDGVPDPGEVCDDGNTNDGDGCSADCRSLELCGNGIPDPGEQCDDGGALLHHNCSSRCTLEIPSWTTDGVPPAGPALMAYDAARATPVVFGVPTNGNVMTFEWDGVAWQAAHPAVPLLLASFNAAMVYDAARQRVVVFGVFDPYEHDAWEWDGTSWTARVAAAAPPAQLFDYAIAYDSARDKVVLFGGRLQPLSPDVLGGAQNRTWEWDGTTWHEIATPVAPPARSVHAMTYDSLRGTVVLYGGQDELGRLLHDTWEYDGATWTPRASSGPPNSAYDRMVFDAARRTVVLFGGFGESIDAPTTAQTWEWDGSRWTMAAELPALKSRMKPGMAYDLARGRVVLFGGELYFNGPLMADTWEWDGATWTQPAGRVEPGPHARHAMALASRGTGVVMFGGVDGSGARQSDTWLWNGSSWTQPATTPPPARADHALAYDDARDRVVLFGGSDAMDRPLGDTWEWDGAGWLPIAAIGPPARAGHAMVHDAARHQTVLIDGAAGDLLLSDQWGWDGTRWTDITPAARPPARRDFAIAYDAARERIVLFGGRGASGLLGDLWEWDGRQWLERTPAGLPGPSPRSGHALAYDPTVRGVVLFGGSDASGKLDDLWAWDGASWIALEPMIPPYPVTAPSPRWHAAVLYDPVRRDLMLLGGEDAATAQGDLWFLRFGGPVTAAP